MAYRIQDKITNNAIAPTKILTLYNGGDIFGEYMLDADVTVSMSSDFQSLIDDGGAGGAKTQALFNLIRGGTGVNINSAFKELGFQIWAGSKPISLSNLTLTFNMVNNAKDDVFDPIKELCKLPLPQDKDKNGGFGLVPPGPMIFDAISTAAMGQHYSCKIGHIYLDWIIVRKAEPTFSIDCDSNGYPIYGKVALDIETVYTGTTSVINGW